MRLDVIVPTYNRHQMLEQTLGSLLRGQMPSTLEVKVTVVDNNSTDNTRQVVEEWAQKFKGRLNYVFERKQGRSSALNAGITSTDGDLIGMIDDDEEIDERWFARVQSAFSQTDVDFIGGPYVPKWGASPPDLVADELCGRDWMD